MWHTDTIQETLEYRKWHSSAVVGNSVLLMGGSDSQLANIYRWSWSCQRCLPCYGWECQDENTSTELVPLDGSFALPGPFQVSQFEETTLNWDFFLSSFVLILLFLLSCRLHQGETWPSSLHHSTERRIICFDRRYRYNNLLIHSSFLLSLLISLTKGLHESYVQSYVTEYTLEGSHRMWWI